MILAILVAYSGVYGKTININDIIGIQFQDEATLIGIK